MIRSGHRKHTDEVGSVEGDVQLVIHQRAVRADIRNVEDVLVGATGKSDADRTAHRRVRAVATDKIPSVRQLLVTISPAQPCRHAVSRLGRPGQLDAALHPHAEPGEDVDE